MTRMRPIWQTLLAALLALGGASAALGVGSGGTGLRVYSQAALHLAGGVVVNGVTFDPSQAGITINGQDGRTAGDLRPGMVAGVYGYVIPGLNVGVARSIQATRVAYGPVTQVGSGGTGLRLAGIYVTPRTDVVLANCATVSDIAVGTTVDVYGYSDGISGDVNATRIECTAPSTSVELHGRAFAITPTSVVVNGVQVDVSNAQFVGFDTPIAVGDRVGVNGTASGTGIIAATVTLDPDAITENGEDTEVEDSISAIISPTVFVIGAFDVDATNAKFSGGSAADLAVGRVAHVQGTVVNGVLNAKSVEFDDDESDDGGYAGNNSGDGAEMDDVEGTIASVASPTSFVVKNVAVDAGAATFVNGSSTSIAVGKAVKVVGRRAGANMKAVRVTFVAAGSTGGGGKGHGGTPGGSAHVEGVVGNVAAPGMFVVGGVQVDARSAKVDGGTLASIGKGTRIHASGAFVAGVLVATRVEIDD
jgi:hypothetical protein